MKLLVFGGTGQTGEAVLQLSTKHPDLEVTAFVRTRSKIPEEVQKHISVVVGDVFYTDDVSQAMVGQEAVISCLGSGTSFDETVVMSVGAKNITTEMRKCGVRKLAVVGVSTLLPGQPDLPSHSNVIDDHRRAIDALKATKDVDWSVLMAPRIIKAESRGFKVANGELPGAKKITPPDMAKWLISYVKNEDVFRQSLHQFVGISSDIIIDGN